MKKISKILSSVIAASMVLSCFAMNAFAIKQDRTYTVKASKTTGLVAGDTITVEVVADTLLHAATGAYYLYFDPAVFTIDTASGGMGKPKKYVDTTWYNTIKDGEQVIGWYWGTSPTSNQNTEEGWIVYAWGGNTDAGAGVEAENNQTNYTIGKFYLTVKDTAANGSTSITVDGKTYGWQETAADNMTYVPATLTVGTPAPEKEDVTISVPDGVVKGKDGVNAGVLASFTVTADNNAVSAVEFVFNNGEEDSAPYEVSLGATVEAGTVKVALNILNVNENTLILKSVKPVAPAAN